MIPILFETSETAFSSNGIGRLTDAISCSVTEERNGIYELEMQYDVEGTHYKDLQLGRFIYATVSNGTKQIFQIYDITRPLNGKVMVYAEHISYRMRMIPVMPYSASGVSAALQGLKNNAVEDCPFSFWTDKTETSTFNLNHPDEMRGKLQGDQWSILQQYGGEFEYDNYIVKYWASRGSDKGVTLRYGKDITDLRQEENIQNTYTGIVPYWYGFVGEEQESVSLPERALYSENVDNFPYRRTVTVDFTDDFPEKPTVEDLRARGQRYLRENEIGIPAVNISLSFVQLSQTLEYKDVQHISDLYLCDIITVKFEKLGVSREAKITRTVWDVLNERYISLGIGQIHHSLAVTIADQGQQIVNVKTNTIPSSTANALNSTQSLIEEQTQKITGQLGGYMIWHDSDGDGEPDELLIMNTSSISTATDVWRWNLAGLGHSSNGYAGPYTLAITADGKINADFIQTGTLNAALVNVINLVATKVQAYNGSNTQLLEIMSGYMDIRALVDGVWRQRVGAFLATGSNGAIRLSSGLVDANGNPQGASRRGLLLPSSIRLGIDENDVSLFDANNGGVTVNNGTNKSILAPTYLVAVRNSSNVSSLYVDANNANFRMPINGLYEGDGIIASHGKASTRAAIIAKRTDTNKSIALAVGSGGTNRGLYSDELGSWLIYTDGVRVHGYAPYDFGTGVVDSGSITLTNATGYNSYLVIADVISGQARMTINIPYAEITTSDVSYQVADESSFLTFKVRKSGTSLIFTIGNKSSTGRILAIYGYSL